MWVMYSGRNAGFVSAVAAPDSDRILVVRARDRASLGELARRANVVIKYSLDTDYPFRVFVDKADFADWLVDRVDGIDYGNFKNSVDKVRPKQWHEALSRVWGAMLTVTPRKVRRAQDRAWREAVWQARLEREQLERLEAEAEDDDRPRSLYSLTEAEWVELMVE